MIAAAAGMPAAAQTVTPYRQMVVVTAATTPVEMGTVTRTLTVITREQIDALPAHSIADVLRLAASVDVRARGIRGVQISPYGAPTLARCSFSSTAFA
jgi:outer membrane cobalamin receptor